VTGAFAADRPTGHRIGRDAGLDGTGVGTVEGNCDVSVVSSRSRSLLVPAAADCRHCLVNVDAADRCGGCDITALSVHVPVFVKELALPSPLTAPPATVSVAIPERTATGFNAGKRNSDISVVPAGCVCLGSAAAGDDRRCLVDIDATDRCRDAALPALSTQLPLFVTD